MYSNKMINFKLKLLQNKTHRFSKDNVVKLKSHNELLLALKKKYPIFFDIIDNNGIQYKQFLSGFFNCILTSKHEPFYIKLQDLAIINAKDDLKVIYNNNDKIIFNIYNLVSANYNYINLVPWNKNNIIKCYSNNSVSLNDTNIRINKDQFMQCVIVLFPKFIKTYPKLFLALNNKLKVLNKETISVSHLYKYLVYCGDTIAKTEYYYNISKSKKKFNKIKYKFNKNKIENFLKIFTYDQLINILIN